MSNSNGNDPVATSEDDDFPVAAIICIAIGGYIVLVVLILVIRQCLMQRGMCGDTCNCCGKEGSPACCECCISCSESCNCCGSPNIESCLDAICPARRQMDCGDIITCQCCSDEDSCCNCCSGTEPLCDCGNCDCSCKCEPPECDNVNCCCFVISSHQPPPLQGENAGATFAPGPGRGPGMATRSHQSGYGAGRSYGDPWGQESRPLPPRDPWGASPQPSYGASRPPSSAGQWNTSRPPSSAGHWDSSRPSSRAAQWETSSSRPPPERY